MFAEFKAITLKRWIRKAIEDKTFQPVKSEGLVGQPHKWLIDTGAECPGLGRDARITESPNCNCPLIPSWNRFTGA
jgi:hypothetical protein